MENPDRAPELPAPLEGGSFDLEALAEAAAAATPDPDSRTGLSAHEVAELPSDLLASCLEQWRVLGLDEALLPEARASLRPAGDSGTTAESLVLDLGVTALPRISIDLPPSAPGTDPAPPRAGRTDLEILSLLGEGGMGRVYLARQHSLDRDVAIKTLREKASGRHREALLAEGAVTGYLEHPSIIPVHALGAHEDGRPVLVMKRVDGVTWQELLRDPAHPAWEGWGGDPGQRLDGHLEILMQVCNAAHFAHSRGIVHRDIKPQNVLIGRYGDVYLADWGLAHRVDGSTTSQLCGTPGYMAPEMAAGGAIDARTDVYLLGATLHELLTGHTRHEGTSLEGVVADALASAPFPYPRSVPEALADLANRATAPAPADRPATAADFRRLVGDHFRHKSSVALYSSALPRLARLRTLIQGDSEGEAAHQEIDRLTTEARFALSQALETWPGNPAARRATDELEGLLDARRAKAADLERLARDLDPRVSARPRTYAVVGLATVAGLVSLPLVLHGPRYQPPPRELFLASLGPLAVVWALTALLRRHLAKSAVNRQTAAGLLAIVSAITCARFLGLRGGTDTPTLLMVDSLLGATLATFTALTLARELAFVALLLLASSFGCAFRPAYAFLWFSLGTGLSLLFMSLHAHRIRPRRPGTKPASPASMEP